MKIIAAVNQKGGVGKTCFVVLFAQHLAKKMDKKVLVIDMDTQMNASFALNNHKIAPFMAEDLFSNKQINIKEPVKNGDIVVMKGSTALSGINQLSLDGAFGLMQNSLKCICDDGNFDFCIIDTAPVLGISLFSTVAVADYAISPIELEIFSLLGIEQITTMIANVKHQFNPKLSFLGMLPSRVDTRSERQRKHLEELQTTYPDYVIPYPVYLRTSIADSVAEKVPIWQIKKTAAKKATKELSELFNHLTNKISDR